MSCSREQGANTSLQEFPSVRGLLLTLAALVTLSGVVGLFAAFNYKETRRIIPGNEHITMDHLFNRTFAAERASLSWVPEGAYAHMFTLVTVELTSLHLTQAGDGVFSVFQDGFIKLVSLESNTTTDLVQISDLRDVSPVDEFARAALDHVHIVGARKSAGFVQLEAFP